MASFHMLDFTRCRPVNPNTSLELVVALLVFEGECSILLGVGFFHRTRGNQASRHVGRTHGSMAEKSRIRQATVPSCRRGDVPP